MNLRRNLDFIEKVSVESVAAHYKDRFDFVVANGRAVQLAQAWSFQLPNQDDLVRDLKAWAWTVRGVRDSGGKVETNERRIDVPRDVDVAAIFIPPLEGAASEALDVAEALCHDAGVRLVPLADVVAAVVRPALDKLGMLTR